MFKLFSVDKNNTQKEILPVNGIYIVYELYEYVFSYSNIILNEKVFIEDEVYDSDLLELSNEGIRSKVKNRIFEDYFGYLIFEINNEKFNFEVRIQKLKVPELEEILLYLWNQDPIIFDNFFSKSTLKSRLDKEKQNLDYSSKFINIFEDFYNFFKNKYFIFRSLPHSFLQKKNVIKDYEFSDISNNSIDWLINNLDELHIDYLYKNVDNSIKIDNDYGLIEKILTEEKLSNFNVYENRIILGSFDFIHNEISKIKHRITTHVVVKQFYEKDFYSIDEFKVIPFIRLKNDLDKIEHKIKILHLKYKEIFVDTRSYNALPKLTPVFSNKRHYSEAYLKIKLIRDINLNLDGELNLLNIKKISTLYERFNLFVLLNSLLEHQPLQIKKQNLKAEENTFKEYTLTYSNFEVHLFYDYIVSSKNDKTGLIRISNNYYKPDYVLKITSSKGTYFFILDSKYSSENTVRNIHLNKCIKNYILDIGILNEPNKKIEELVLLYPGNVEDLIYGSNIYTPRVSIIPSKLSKVNLNEFVKRVINYYT